MKRLDAHVANLQAWRGPTHHQAYNVERHRGGLAGPETEVVFRGLQDRVIQLIDATQGSEFICGAVAWLTNTPILKALGRARQRGVTVLVVVQKEDFLRPDVGLPTDKKAFARQLRVLYDALGSYNIADAEDGVSALLRRYGHNEGPFESEDDAALCEVAAVRCLGNHNRDKSPTHPRMHNKFWVFGHWNYEHYPTINHTIVNAEPTTVWTGSYNCSATAERSFENAVILRQPDAASMYLSEFALLYLLSEPLDWTSAWMAPDIFHGT